MERLEVSGAVRPIYGSLGIKRLRPEVRTVDEACVGKGEMCKTLSTIYQTCGPHKSKGIP